MKRLSDNAPAEVIEDNPDNAYVKIRCKGQDRWFLRANINKKFEGYGNTEDNVH